MADEEFATDVNPAVRDAALASVGEMLYQAASPDVLDGLSNAEFAILNRAGPDFFRLWEYGERAGVPGLPAGFAEHYKRDVLPDLRIIRNDPELRQEYRRELRQLLEDPNRVANLYRKGGDTYSDMLAQVAHGPRTNMPHLESGMFRKQR